MPRIASLLPSATEIVAALGFRDQLVGRSHECDFPYGVEALPVLTRPSFFPEGISREIDREVKALLERGLSLYQVDVEKLRELKPEIIVTQSQCEVCAVSEDELQNALREWVGNRARIISLRGENLEGVWSDIQDVADSLAAPEAGRALLASLRTRIADIAARADKINHRPSVVCLEWLDPLMAAGNWVPELVALAGGRNLLGRSGEHSPWTSWEQLAVLDPETLITLPCGFGLAKIREEMRTLTSQAAWKTLSAVRSGRVFLTDGNQYFNRPGPRLVESLEILAEILHPEHFDFGHRGGAWEIYPQEA